MASIPRDIYPESGFRLPFPKREDFDDAGKELFDQIVNKDDAELVVGLRGPAGIELHDPQLALNSGTVFRYLRFENGLTNKIRELAVLVTAREMDSRFEWAAHETLGLQEGISKETISIIKTRGSTEGLPEIEAIVIQLGREMFSMRLVSSETFAQALKIFGRKGLVNLVVLMAQYSALAAELRVFNNQVSPDQPAL